MAIRVDKFSLYKASLCTDSRTADSSYRAEPAKGAIREETSLRLSFRANIRYQYQAPPTVINTPNQPCYVYNMRFKASIRNISTFISPSSNDHVYCCALMHVPGLTASLSSLGKDVWLQLNNEQLRFTVVPEQGSQVWAYASYFPT